MKILITGATGFIGKHVCRKIISQGHEVIALSRSDISERNEEAIFNSITWIQSSLALTAENLDRIKIAQPELVIHLAWENIPDFSYDTSFKNLRDHIGFFHEILKILSIKKIIVAGSCWEYGKKHGVCMESDPCISGNYFTWAKNSLREFLQVECLNMNIVLIWTRVFYAYGLGQRSEALIPTIINNLSSKIVPDIKTPKNENDYIYIEDIVMAFEQFIEQNVKSGIYNIGSGSPISVLDVVRTAEKIISGDEKMTNLLSQTSLNTKKESDFWASMEKTNSALKWKPKISLSEGIKEMARQLVRN